MRRNTFLLSFLILLIYSALLKAEEPLNLDLTTAIRLAVEKNQTILKNAQNSLDLARLSRIDSYKIYQPHAGLTAEAKHARTETEDLISSLIYTSNTETYSTGFNFNWPVTTFTGGTFTTQSGYNIYLTNPGGVQEYNSIINLELGYRQPLSYGGRLKEKFILYSAEQQYKKAKLDYEQNLNNLLLEVTESYYNLVKLCLNIEQAKEEVELTQKLLVWAEGQYKVGEIAELDVLYIKVQLASAEDALLQVEEAEEKAKRAFLRLIGLGNNLDVNLADTVDIMPISFTEPDSVQAAWQHRSEIKQLEISLKTSRQDIFIVGSVNKPTLNLSTDYNLTGNGNKALDSLQAYPQKNWSISANIEFPFFDSKTTYNRVEIAKLEYQKLKTDLNNLKDDIKEQIRDIYNSLGQTQKRLDLLHVNIEVAEKAYRTSKLKYEMGIAPVRDVLQAQIAYAAMKRQLEAAKIDYLLNEAKLYQARGELANVYLK